MDQARQVLRCGREDTEGLTGSGVGVAVLDTGIYPHDDFGGRIGRLF